MTKRREILQSSVIQSGRHDQKFKVRESPDGGQAL